MHLTTQNLLKRNRSDQPEDLTEAQRRHDTEESADQRATRWRSQLPPMEERDTRDATEFIQHVAHGQLNRSDTWTSQDVFNGLICHDAIDLFAELFTVRVGRLGF